MTQYHLVAANTMRDGIRYLVIRTPDYSSSTWNNQVKLKMFTELEHYEMHYDAPSNRGKSIQEAIKDSSKDTTLLRTFDSIENIEEDYPELFI